MAAPAVGPASCLRILAVAPTFYPVQGGAERWLAEVLGAVAARHDVRLLAPEPPPRHRDGPVPYLPFAVDRYVDRWNLERLPGRRLHRGYAPPFSLAAIAATRSIARSFRPDVITVHYAIPTGLAGLVAARRAGIPWTLTFLGRDVPGPATPPGWGWWDRWLAVRADGVMVISDFCREALFGGEVELPATSGGEIQDRVDIAAGGADLSSVTPRRVVTVGAGVTIPTTSADPAATAALQDALGIPPATTVLLALQRLSAYKGVDVLVEALARLRREGVDVALVVVGAGPERDRLAALAAAAGVADRVRLPGFVPDDALAAYWAMADVFVFHSYFETFGLVLAEAMARCKPIVAARSTAIPEVVADGVTGLLAAPGDAATFAASIRALVDDPGRRRVMGEAGRAVARERFRWEDVARRYEAELVRVTGTSRIRAASWPPARSR